jgi:hypothetical protein
VQHMAIACKRFGQCKANDVDAPIVDDAHK